MEVNKQLTIVCVVYNYKIQYNIFILITIYIGVRVRVMVFNVTFNNISAISWRSVLLVEETEAPGENQRPVVSP